IIDTPPSRNALDFLQAPQRLGNLFSDSVFRKAIRSSVKTGRFGLKMLAFFTSPFRMIFEKILGGQVLSDISDFFQLGDELFFEGFKERAVLIREVLSGPESLFLGIASPMYAPMKEGLFLYDTLKEFQMPFGGFIINRVHPELVDIQNLSLLTENSDIAGQSDSDQNLSEKLLKNYSDFKKLGESDASSIARLKKKVGKNTDVITIPYFDQDVYDFAGLLRIYRYLAE
ncbi:hypothetical protein QUF76_16845, partial [Desulfobacterales bacterium HSG16]|nr:hypothetical protein [Desulfobacterales bacterium HSG16]